MSTKLNRSAWLENTHPDSKHALAHIEAMPCNCQIVQNCKNKTECAPETLPQTLSMCKLLPQNTICVLSSKRAWNHFVLQLETHTETCESCRTGLKQKHKIQTTTTWRRRARTSSKWLRLSDDTQPVARKIATPRPHHPQFKRTRRMKT